MQAAVFSEDSGETGDSSCRGRSNVGQPREARSAKLPRLCLGVLSILSAGCHSPDGRPSIEFTVVPRAAAGSPNRLTSIQGRVSGTQPRQFIVLYAKDQGHWYVQPYGNHPFTKIEPDSTWKSLIHPGTEYAALLVGPEFPPPPITDVLPTQGVIAWAMTKGTPPFWLSWWFMSASVLLCLSSVFALHRAQLQQMADRLNERFEERLAERMRVAQMLHDTLLQGVISTSMQLQMAMGQLPADSPALDSLRRVLTSIGQVVDEGRTTLKGLRSEESVHDLERALSRVPQEIDLHEDIDFRVRVKGRPLPLQPPVRVGLYSIGREALLHAFRQLGANDVQVELRYTPSQFLLLVRHNGRHCGPALAATPEGSPFTFDVREQAQKLGARLKVRNRLTGGTEMKLVVPAKIAFESRVTSRPSRLLGRLL